MYDQVRFLDKNGQELIRVNFNDGKPALVSEEQLQNKAKRYYFADTFALEPGRIFVSPFDLNVEQGQVELPLKPTAELPDYIPTFGFGVNHNILIAEVWPWLEKGWHRWWEHMIVGRKDFTLSAYA